MKMLPAETVDLTDLGELFVLSEVMDRTIDFAIEHDGWAGSVLMTPSQAKRYYKALLTCSQPDILPLDFSVKIKR